MNMIKHIQFIGESQLNFSPSQVPVCVYSSSVQTAAVLESYQDSIYTTYMDKKETFGYSIDLVNCIDIQYDQSVVTTWEIKNN